jgi:hypothetical protein
MRENTTYSNRTRNPRGYLSEFCGFCVLIVVRELQFRQMRFFSPDAYVMVRPASAFRALAAQPAVPGPWTAWRRPLFMAFLLGCTISLTTTGSLTLRLVVSAALSWSFVPAIEIAALAIVLHGAGHWGRLPRLVEMFCMGCSVWSVWLIGVSIIFAAVPPAHVFTAF